MISSLVSNNWITILFIVMFGLLVVLNYYFNIRFVKFYKLFQIKQYLVDYVSITSVFNTFNVILLFFQISCYALLIVKIIGHYYVDIINSSYLFGKIGLIIFIFYVIRYFLGKLIAYVVGLKLAHEPLSIIKLTHLSKVALLIFPILVVINYIDFKNNLLFVVLGIITMVFLLVRYVRILKENQKLIFNNLFYFILYLCTLEIAPLFFIYKVFIFRL